MGFCSYRVEPQAKTPPIAMGGVFVPPTIEINSPKEWYEANFSPHRQMMPLKKRIRPKSGDLFLVPVAESIFGLGRVLDPIETAALYDVKLTREPQPNDLEDLLKSRVAFKIWIYKSAFQKSRWPIIANFPLEEELKAKPIFVHAGASGPNGEYMLTTNGSDLFPITNEDVQTLELLAVWEPEHVEGRLMERFEGRSISQWLYTESVLGLNNKP